MDELDDNPNEVRTRQPTEKGRQLILQTKIKQVNNCLSKYRKSVAQTEIQLADCENTQTLREVREILDSALNDITKSYEELQSLNEDFDVSITKKVENTEEKHLNMLQRITDKIQDLEYEQLSHVSSNSHHSNRTNRSSRTLKNNVSTSNHSKRSVSPALSFVSTKSKHELIDETHSEIAMIKTNMKYVDAEAQQKIEMEKLKLQKKLDMANAKLAALSKPPPTSQQDSPMNKGVDDQNKQVQELYTRSSNANNNAQFDVNAPDFIPARYTDQISVDNQNQESTSLKNTETNLTTNQLALEITEQINLNRVPTPEPSIFSGECLQYLSWKSAFDILIHRKNIPECEKIFYLKRYLGGSAREMVEGYLLIPSSNSYKAARQLLDERFGDPFTVANAFRDKIEAWPNVPDRDGTALRRLADFLQQCLLAMENVPSLKILNDERENLKILRKLPDWFNLRWARFVAEWRQRTKTFPPYNEFVNMITKESNIACDPCVSLQALSKTNADKQQGRQGSKSENKTATTFATETGSNQQEAWCHFCLKYSHSLDDCSTFESKTYDEKREFILKNGLCFGCLRKGHMSSACDSRKTCKHCNRKHPSCIHKPTNEEHTVVSTDNKNQTAVTAQGSSTDMDLTVSSKSTSIIPVYVSHDKRPDVEILVYAMLDTQSDTTFLLDSTRELLEIQGSDTSLILSTMSRQNEIIATKRVCGLKIRGYKRDVVIDLPPSYTRSQMPVNKAHIPTQETARKWDYLQRIESELTPLIPEIEVALLIGYDCARALLPREVLPDPNSVGPYGLLTDLGWSIVGTKLASEDDGPIGVSQRVSCNIVESSTGVVVSGSRMKETPLEPSPGMPLPFVPEQLPLDSSRNVAETRLKSLKNEAEKQKKKCLCDPRMIKRQRLKEKEPWKNFQETVIKLSIIIAWVIPIFVAYKASHVELDLTEFDPFAELEIDWGASDKEIRKAYRTLSLQYYPDKARDPKRFTKITRAYKSLTDEETKKNWEEHGKPDGPGVTSFGIALPKWLIKSENSVWVLAAYGLVFMIILLVTVGSWWYKSIKFSAEPILMDTT